MYKKDYTLITICAIAVTGCVAIVAIFAMYFIYTAKMKMPATATVAPQTQVTSSSVDISQLKSDDGQPLILPKSG